MSARALKFTKVAVVAVVLFGAAGWLVYEILPDKAPTRNFRVKANSPDEIVFDFSSKPILQLSERSKAGLPVSLVSIQIWQLDGDGHKVRCMWSIKMSPEGDPEVTRLQYGQLPDKWLEQQKALPLESHKVYSMNDRIFFKSGSDFVVLPGSYAEPTKIAEQVRKIEQTWTRD